MLKPYKKFPNTQYTHQKKKIVILCGQHKESYPQEKWGEKGWWFLQGKRIRKSEKTQKKQKKQGNELMPLITWKQQA